MEKANPWIEIENLIEEKRARIEYLHTQLMDGVVTFNNEVLKQEGFLHKSSKRKDVWQFTYFDKCGPVGDFEGSSYEVLATKIDEYGFQPCPESELKHTILAKNKHKNNQVKSRIFCHECER